MSCIKSSSLCILPFSYEKRCCTVYGVYIWANIYILVIYQRCHFSGIFGISRIANQHQWIFISFFDDMSMFFREKWTNFSFFQDETSFFYWIAFHCQYILNLNKSSEVEEAGDNFTVKIANAVFSIMTLNSRIIICKLLPNPYQVRSHCVIFGSCDWSVLFNLKIYFFWLLTPNFSCCQHKFKDTSKNVFGSNFIHNVPLADKPGSWFLLAKCHCSTGVF